MTSRPFRSNAWRCCERRCAFSFSFTFQLLTVPFSLICRPCVSRRLRHASPSPHPVAAPSPRVALTTSSPPRRPLATRPLVASPLATRHPRRVPPSPRVPSSRRPLATRPLVASPLATRPFVASPLATRHPRRVTPRHAPLVALRAVLWGKWRGSSEWVGRGECELGVV